MELNREILSKAHISVVYPSPTTIKNARFAYSIECLSLATLIKTFIGNVNYYDLSIDSGNEDRLLNDLRYDTRAKKIIFLYIDSVPLHRSSNYQKAHDLALKIREGISDVLIVACGPWCICRKQKFTPANLTLFNEPEYDAREIFSNGQHDSGSIQIPGLIDDLGILPFPERHLLRRGIFTGNVGYLKNSAVVQTTRGCKNACQFCPRQAWTLRKIRHRPFSQILDEMQYLADSGIRNIWIDDDNMGCDQNWSINLFREIAKLNDNHKLNYFISADVRISEDFFIEAHNAGVKIISFGIESGSDRIIQLLNKPINSKYAVRAIELANKHGMFTVGNFIIGSPGETYNDINKTKIFLQSTPLDSINIKILSYVVGAPLWSEAVNKFPELHDQDCFFACYETNTSGFYFHELAAIQKKLYEEFNNSHNRLKRLKTKLQIFGLPYSS